MYLLCTSYKQLLLSDITSTKLLMNYSIHRLQLSYMYYKFYS